MELTFKVEKLPNGTGTTSTPFYISESGGRGANQALAACRAGSKVALVGKVGDDDFGTHILNKLRREGVTTSGTGKSTTPTGCEIHTHEENGKTQHTVAYGANAEAESDQVPEEILGKNAIVLVQTDINTKINAEILEKAKKDGAQTILNLSPSIELTQKTLDHLDYLIVNHDEIDILADKLGLGTAQSAIKIAHALAKAGNLNCIVTLGEEGSLAVTKDEKAWKVGVLELDEVVDKKGAEDVYCGTFSSCIYEGMPIEKSIKYASIAASLCCTKTGGQSSFPYIDEIKEKLEELEDAQPIEL